MKKVILTVVPLILLSALAGCARAEKEITRLSELVYERGVEESRYSVMIEEDGIAVPYLVLDSSGEACLLVRKHLLDAPMIYNRSAPCGAYYAESVIDLYLENDFMQRYSADVLSMIRDTDILITTKDSLYTGTARTETVQRRVFLLSYTDVGGDTGKTIAVESKRLDYFRNEENRVATYENGMPGTWWLRTPQTWYDTLVCTVGLQGELGSGGIGGLDGETVNGVRPALCMDANTPVSEHEGVFRIG